MSTTIIIILLLFLLTSSYLILGLLPTDFFTTYRHPTLTSPTSPLPSYLLRCTTSHARHLPTPSRHTFSYPLLYLSLDIDSLSSHSLDLPSRLFRWGSRWAFMGLRLDTYLRPPSFSPTINIDPTTATTTTTTTTATYHEEKVEKYGGKGTKNEKDGLQRLGGDSLRSRVESLVKDAGITEEVGKIWLVTMPSYFGFEGINPLSVWYVYSPVIETIEIETQSSSSSQNLVCIILEVHNTFGEKHAYVLPKNSHFQHPPAEGYDLAWTFPRSFHVSPFNSRDGYYRLDIVDPFPSSSNASSSTSSTFTSHSRPLVKIFLRLLTPDKQLKLHATLTSSTHSTSLPIPLSSSNTLQILSTLLELPFTLLLTSPRIMWQAYKLHYLKRLAVYPRPEPIDSSLSSKELNAEPREMYEVQEKGEGGGSGGDKCWNPPHEDSVGIGFGLDRQAKKGTEIVAERVIKSWAPNRAREIGIDFIIRQRNQVIFSTFSPKPSDSNLAAAESFNDHSKGLTSFKKIFVINTFDPLIFTHLITMASPSHFLLLASENQTTISSITFFNNFFTLSSSSTRTNSSTSLLSFFFLSLPRLSANLRTSYTRYLLSHSRLPPPPHYLPINPSPHLADTSSSLSVLWVLSLTYFADWIEEEFMFRLGAVFVDGSEPWRVYERALAKEYGVQVEKWQALGSTRY